MTLGKVKLLGQQEVRHLSLRVAIEVRGQQAAEFLLQCNHLRERRHEDPGPFSDNAVT